MESTRTILYIEDNPANYRLVERLLRDEGFQVLHAKDGFEGVQRAIEERDRLDLILLDINLPGMDGYEAATKLKAIQGFESIPIIAVTVNALKGDRKRSLAAGCDGYIPKPIDIHSFPQRVREYIRGRREKVPAAEERYYLREHTRKLVDRLESSLGQLKLSHEQICHKDKLASLGEMAASIAHELNNPLSSISFAVQLLLRDLPQAGRQRQNLEMVGRNVGKIQRLAEALTNFSRPSEATRGFVDVGKVLDEAALLSEHEFRCRDIEVIRSVQPELPAVFASESQLHHVFLNLLRNAAQAVESRKASLTDETGFRGAVRVEAGHEGNGFVRVEVTDNGAGIHPDYQNRLFTPFFTTKPRGQGTGLGLYIVKQILDDLGGRVEVSSTVDLGTTFRIHLPRAAEAGRPH
ncbi:MAG: response regulator [Proteobacteria bacterium]|nr:response regulator [Pseudomonadota bacterium]